MRFPYFFPFFITTGMLALLPAHTKTITEIPFQYRDGFLWLKVEAVGQRKPLNFLLDSGAASSVLNIETARSLHLKLGRWQFVRGVDSLASAYHVSQFKAQVADITLPESVLAMDLQGVSRTCHQPIDGLLGSDFFRCRVVQIDFAAGKVRILDDAQPDGPCETLPIKMCNNAFCVPVRIDGSLSSYWMRVDTGCDSSLEWVANDVRMRRDNATSIGLPTEQICYIHANVQLGVHSLSGVKIGLHEQQLFPGEAGLLGNGLLSQFRVTIDASHGRLILENIRSRS